MSASARQRKHEEERGRIALYGSTELTLPDDSTHPPDSIYTGLR